MTKRSSVTVLTQSNAVQFIKSGIVAVKVWGPNCASCLAAKTIWQEIAENSTIRISNLNVKHAPALAKRWRIRAVPTFIIFRSGKEIARYNGPIAKKSLSAWVKKYDR